MKKIFDEIFETAKLSKKMDELKKLQKEYKSKVAKTKQRIELDFKDFDALIEYRRELNKHKAEKDLRGNNISKLRRVWYELTTLLSPLRRLCPHNWSF